MHVARDLKLKGVEVLDRPRAHVSFMSNDEY